MRCPRYICDQDIPNGAARNQFQHLWSLSFGDIEDPPVWVSLPERLPCILDLEDHELVAGGLRVVKDSVPAAVRLSDWEALNARIFLREECLAQVLEALGAELF